MREFFKSEAFRRAARTFIQAVSAYIVVNAMSVDFTAESAVKGFIVASIAAGIAGIMNIDSGKNEKNGDE